MNSRIEAGNVLCRTCANWLGRSYSPERRRPPRVCSADHEPLPEMFSCESYVGRPLTQLIPPPRSRRVNAQR